MSTNDPQTADTSSALGGGQTNALGELPGAIADLAAAFREVAEAIRSSAMILPVEYELVPCAGDGGEVQEPEDGAQPTVQTEATSSPPCPCAEEDKGLPVLAVPCPSAPRDDVVTQPCASPQAQRAACAGDSDEGGRHRRSDSERAAPTPVAVP